MSACRRINKPVLRSGDLCVEIRRIKQVSECLGFRIDNIFCEKSLRKLMANNSKGNVCKTFHLLIDINIHQYLQLRARVSVRFTT